MAKYPSLTCFVGLLHGCDLVWNFLASRHYKGEVDSAGALCKPKIQSKQMKLNAQRLKDAIDIVAFLRLQSHKNHAAYSNARKVVNKHFWLVGASDVMCSCVPNVSTIPGNQSMHQVCALYSYTFSISSITKLFVAKYNFDLFVANYN